MSKLQVFEVLFDGDVDLFRAGDWVQGHVRIVLSETKSHIRGIQIIYQGKAKTHWTESQGTGDDRRDVEIKSTEKYFEEKLLILGKDKNDKSGERVSLVAGEHKYPFKFQIPTTPLPHAYEGSFYGHIRYRVKAKIDRPWKFNHTTQRLFNIVGIPVDLNTKPQAPMPSMSEDEKTVCCLCCASGPIKASAQTDKSGYVPGETIWVSGMVENNSGREICDITARLYQNAHFKVKRKGINRQELRTRRVGFEPHRTELHELGEQKGERCGGHRTVTFDRKPILVPSCPPSGLDGCDIISIGYYVEFKADVKGTLLDLQVKLPITIGTVPLYSAYSAAAFPPGVVTQQPTAQPPEVLPPSYKIAMGGPREIRKGIHDYPIGKLMFAPKYPYYTFPNAGDRDHPPPEQSMDSPQQGDPAHSSSYDYKFKVFGVVLAFNRK